MGSKKKPRGFIKKYRTKKSKKRNEDSDRQQTTTVYRYTKM